MARAQASPSCVRLLGRPLRLPPPVFVPLRAMLVIALHGKVPFSRVAHPWRRASKVLCAVLRRSCQVCRTSPETSTSTCSTSRWRYCACWQTVQLFAIGHLVLTAPVETAPDQSRVSRAALVHHLGCAWRSTS